MEGFLYEESANEMIVVGNTRRGDPQTEEKGDINLFIQ